MPLAKQSSLTQFFTAISTFQSCLQGLGVTFIGIPDASNPNSPANDPTYIKNLTTCAAQSNILNALKAASTAQDNLTPAQIALENRAYLKWRTCMIGRGWGIPTPTPDSKGRLFSFGGAAASATGGSSSNATVWSAGAGAGAGAVAGGGAGAAAPALSEITASRTPTPRRCRLTTSRARRASS